MSNLFFMSNPHNVKCFGHFPAMGVSNHRAIYAIVNTFTTRKTLKTIKVRNINDINVDQVAQFAGAIDWTSFYASIDVDEQMKFLYDIMDDFLRKVCPEREIVSKNDPVPWMNNLIRDQMLERKQLYDVWAANRKHHSGPSMYD